MGQDISTEAQTHNEKTLRGSLATVSPLSKPDLWQKGSSLSRQTTRTDGKLNVTETTLYNFVTHQRCKKREPVPFEP